MMVSDDGGTVVGRSRAPVGLRDGVPDERVAFRDLRVFDGVEVARIRNLPGEVEVPPLRGYAVSLRISGTGRLVTRFDGRTWERQQVAGRVEVFTSAEPVQWVLDGPFAENIIVLLERNFVRRIASESEIDPDGVEVLNALNARDPKAERILTMFLEEVGSGGLGGGLYARSLAGVLAVHLLREHSSLGGRDKRKVEREPEGSLSGRALKRATDYVGDNLAGEISLAEVAGAANLSERHFSRLFKASTGLSPHQYVIRQRVEKAKNLLAETDLPVVEVALLCGFAHQGHLARHFGRLIGTPPARFRRESRR